MGLDAVWAFALVAALVTLTPGVDTMLVLSTATRHGARRGVLTSLGTLTGLYCWGLAAATGTSAVLTASTGAYTALRTAGAAYLFWLGLRALRSLLRTASPPPADPVPAVLSGRRAYVQGLLTNLLNPKIGVLYLSLLPQFVPADAAALPAGLLLASVHAVEGAVFLGGISLLAHRAGAWLRRPRVARGLDGVCAAVFLGFGARLALVP
ncbi:Threonine/homoserine/homoserine lactone efflux protein [Geodermatophilus pulveris]|uniref:Threonine/homoserine/homoserine lactone efflux protein n=1 Tax=Geodermatophilus pulveris TaxID=1564159 RepID=A0A239J224_9ACTN|nr:LysE family translocator [Geodermatophilus pulveris]SNS98714.1 Threonine/homoserine/homoserine lactone efflux protein [Geodermatophilus pulveris]